MDEKITARLQKTVENLGIMPTNTSYLEFQFYSVCLQVTNQHLEYPVPTFRVLSINLTKAQERYNYQQLKKTFNEATIKILKKNECYLLNNNDDANDNEEEKEKLKYEFVKYEHEKQVDFNKRRYEQVKTTFEADEEKKFQDSLWVKTMCKLRRVDPEFKPKMGCCINSEYLTAQKYRNKLRKHTHEEIKKLVEQNEKEVVNKLDESVYNRLTPFAYYNEPLMKEMYDQYLYDMQQSQLRQEDKLIERLSDVEMEIKMEKDNVLNEPFVSNKLKTANAKFVSISYVISKDKMQVLFWVHAHFKEISKIEQDFTSKTISKYSFPLSLHVVRMGYWVSPCHNEWFVGSDKVEQITYDNEKFSTLKQQRANLRKENASQIQYIQEYRKKKQSPEYVAEIKNKFNLETDYDAEIFITASYNNESKIQDIIHEFADTDLFHEKCYEFINEQKKSMEPTFIKHWAMERLFLSDEDYDMYLKYVNEDQKNNLISNLSDKNLFDRMSWFIKYIQN